jgi:hypothetical protein
MDLMHSEIARRDMLIAVGAAAMGPLARAQQATQPRQDDDLVKAFVVAGHADPSIPKVKEMLARDPKLATAAWDWGGGDWETALGGAAHVGSREMAHFLLENGARVDAFVVTMLGLREPALSLLAVSPAVARVRGPHGFSLMYHAAISGSVPLAQAIAAHLPKQAPDYNQALLSAAGHGRVEMTEWLLANGVTDPNMKDFRGKRPLTIATERGFKEIAEALRKFGAMGEE